jgi:hypothetical protein
MYYITDVVSVESTVNVSPITIVGISLWTWMKYFPLDVKQQTSWNYALSYYVERLGQKNIKYIVDKISLKIPIGQSESVNHTIGLERAHIHYYTDPIPQTIMHIISRFSDIISIKSVSDLRQVVGLLRYSGYLHQ